MLYGPSQFQSTVIKPYYKDNSSEPVQDALENTLKDTLEDAPEDALKNALEDTPEDALKENYNQCALEGNYNSNTIVVDVPQL